KTRGISPGISLSMQETRKFPSRSCCADATFMAFVMTCRPILIALTFAIAFSSGCTLFRKSDKSKGSSAISREVEENFRRRWVENRIQELGTQGVAAEAARAQAESEFRARFNFARPNAK